MARPCKNNPEWKQKKQAFEQAKENGKLQKFFEALKWWLSRSSAMAYSGLPMSSVYAWIEQDANFKREIEHCEEYRVAIVENEKRKKIQDEHYRPAIEKELETSKFERYWKREKKDINIDGTVNLKDLSDEELLKIIKGG